MMMNSSHPVHSTLDGLELSPTDHTLPQRLNPAFVAWLMGLPWWWMHSGVNNSAQAEMAQYRSRLQQRLSHLFEES